MRRSHHFSLIVFGLIASSFFFSPFPSLAAEVCCPCRGPSDVEDRCLKIDAAQLQNLNNCSTLPQNINLPEGWTCGQDTIPLAQCESVSDGGICTVGPESALSHVGEAVEKKETVKKDDSASAMTQLNVDIPGFVASQEPSEVFTNYILAVYRYGISIAMIAATIMFIYGAFLYLIGTAMSSIRSGKRIMTDAVIGMILVFSAALIARTLNPTLLDLKSLELTPVETIHWQEIAVGTTSGPGVITPQQSGTKADARAFNEAVSALTERKGVTGLACIVQTILYYESRGNPLLVGHDENARMDRFAVSSRQRFISSGTFYSGGTFPSVPCQSRECQTKGPMNDDSFDISKPPDYGLDWRFSHGFGAVQITYFPESKPCPGRESEGRGVRRGNTCYTIPDIMNTDKQAEIVVNSIASLWRFNRADPVKFFSNYMSGDPNKYGMENVEIKRRVNKFYACGGMNE